MPSQSSWAICSEDGASYPEAENYPGGEAGLHITSKARARASVTGAIVNVDSMGDQVTKLAFGLSKAERK